MTRASAHPPANAVERLRRALMRLPRPLVYGTTPRGALICGVLASVLGTIASWGVGFMPSAQGSIFATAGVLRPLRVNDIGLFVCAVVLVLSAIALMWAWTQMGRYIRGAGGLKLATRAVLIWSAPWLVSFPVMSRDVFSYAAQGRLLMLGQDPYHDVVGQMPGWLAQGSDGLWAQSSSPYGPLFLLIAEGVTAISAWRPEIYVVLFRLLACAGVLLCLVTLPRLARSHGTDAGWAVWIVLANPLFIYSMVASAHNDSIMVGLMLAGFTAALHKKRASAILLVAAAIAIKPIMVIALPAVGLALVGTNATWRARFLAWGVTGVVVGGVLAVLGGMTGLWFGWIGAMMDQGGAAFPFAPYGLLGLGLGALVALVAGPAAGSAVQSVVYSLGKVVAIGAAFWLALRHPRTSPVWQTGCVLLLAVIMNPVIQPWYLFWVLPFFAAWRAWHGPWEQILLAGSAFLAFYCLVDQLSLPEWVNVTVIKLTALAIGGLAWVFLFILAPSQRAMFHRFSLKALWRGPTESESIALRPLVAQPADARSTPRSPAS
ncbi:polyprenol phosphomannose-dependent alpha 1,6 mannosyltransferase MptB [Galactobacter caseinivorans]|uniref:DUF2029 domain-containing protein n=1 Tax=Galactobacter caseinivorans TaxID=2676123 RepID=A0A496PGY4_9MICC|nr:polyprenol phosphomannose-dependent alpha 1,6 mannosyltransferase MptB [Galactobacter caseinivorans]RKW69744.1 DUF2029 domain-containing protein [Galactobacter caseinivorans]